MIAARVGCRRLRSYWHDTARTGGNFAELEGQEMEIDEGEYD